MALQPRGGSRRQRALRAASLPPPAAELWRSQASKRPAAAAVARHPSRPTDVFVADVAETDGGFKLVELNTFGTAGLYAGDLEAVVRAVSPYTA